MPHVKYSHRAGLRNGFGGWVLLAALAPLASHAAAPAPPTAPVAPDSGNLLQQITPNTPPQPSPSATGLTVERESGGTVPQSEAFQVTSVAISGNTRIDTATLHTLVADAEGKSLTLAQLAAVADRITDYYHKHNYPLARAIIPAQTIRGGAVTIQVLEASYGKVTLDNQSHVTDSLLQSTLAPLHGGEVIEQSEMDHVLLLLSDVPKIDVNAVIKPGDSVGTSDLAITTLPGPRLTGVASVDDYGNRYTGRERLAGSVSLIDPLAHGDFLTLSGLTSGDRLNYARASYEATVTGWGTRVGGAYSALHYILGDGLRALDGSGTAGVGSAWAKQPLVRSESANLYAQIQYDALRLRDEIGASAIHTNRHLNTFTASLTGDSRDALWAGGVNTWDLGVSGGNLGFDNDAAQTADAASARTRGDFSKVNLNLARLQKLSASNGLYLSFAGQWTADNLDSSQKMIGGGPYTVRSYDLGVVSGDTGYLGTAEFQHDLGAWFGQWQAATFIDSEHIVINKTPWVPGPNSANLSGAGLGMNWSGPYQLSARAYVAARFGGVSAVVPDSSSVRVWIELTKLF
jgi:hemolysin activation/secretion protein